MGKRYLGGGISFEQKDVYQEFSEDEGGGGGGGSTTLAGLTDVDITDPTDGQTLVYNAESGKWENGAGGGGFVLLHGTYSYDEVEGQRSVTLPYTASELYTMVRSSYVAFDYIMTLEGESTTRIRPITSASIGEVEGEEGAYLFQAAESATGWIAAAESVVFTEIYD